MRRRQLLLAASALTFGCKKEPLPHSEPLPGNPKGAFYDAALDTPGGDAGVAPVAIDAAATSAPADAVTLEPADDKPKTPPIKGNPKGSYYDKGLEKL